MTSLVKLRVREQIWFIKTCIEEDLATRRVWNTVERLELRRNQGEKLRRTLMKNHRRELHQKMAKMWREVTQKEEKAKELLSGENFATLKRCRKQEEEHARRKMREHYRKRIDWIRKKTKERTEEALPKEIDGVKMEDQVLDEQFNASVKCYGGVTLDEEENEALKLQPNFAVYDDVNELSFMANTEKTFNALRWNEAFRRKEDEEGGRGTTEEQNPEPFFNEETRTFDATRIQNRDIPFRKRVTIPECAEPTTEAKLTLCRENLNKVLEEYKGNQARTESNLTKPQKRGLRKLRRRVKNKEIVCFQTDKSGSMSVDTPENYVDSMQPHLEGTIPSTEDEYVKTEKLINAHMTTWCRVMKFDKRVARNFINENNDIPPLYGLRKDHKEIPAGEEKKGPPQRPVCGAVVASNYCLSHFISTVLQPVIQQAKHPCNSTEDMLSRVRKVNQTVDLKNCIIGSMDVKALYPSIDIDFAVEKCVEVITTSEVTFNNIDTDELGLYLALTVSKYELAKEKLAEYSATRRRTGKNPTITGCGVKERAEERWGPWIKPQTKPEGDELKRTVAYALGIAMKTVLKNHIFRFKDEIRKQANGGAIGVKAAGDIASLFMCWWDKTFLERVNEALQDLNLYLRYVDDEYLICEIVPENDENHGQPPDERTMRRLQRIGNEIHPSIQVTVDFPSNNQNGRMPVLDTEHWMQDVMINGVSKRQVIHSHYSKPMANAFVTHKDSAISNRTKESILIADLTRVMRNISLLCTAEERREKVQQYLARMQYSGYGMEERVKIYKAAKKRFDEMVRKDENGTEPLYRSKNWNRIERNREKERKKSSWFKGDGSETVFFVDATPGSELAERCKKEFNKAGLRIKVIERSGRSIKKTLVKSNPFKKKGCDRSGCQVCALGGDVDCKARGIHYRISCDGADAKGNACVDVDYEGETSRSAEERFGGHMSIIRSKSEQVRQGSFIYKHIWESHNGEVPPLKMEVLGKFPGDPGLRQATEAVSIRKNKPSLNGKDEWTNEPRRRKQDTR